MFILILQISLYYKPIQAINQVNIFSGRRCWNRTSIKGLEDPCTIHCTNRRLSINYKAFRLMNQDNKNQSGGLRLDQEAMSRLSRL